MGILAWLGELLSSAVTTFVSLFSLAGNFAYSIFRLIKAIPRMVTFLTSAITLVPTNYLPFLAITISIAVLFFITGKGK